MAGEIAQSAEDAESGGQRQAELLEAKGYTASRFNPKDRYDRTKQYRLLPANLAAALKRWAEGGSTAGSQPSPDLPNASGTIGECTRSTAYGDRPIRQKGRMHPVKAPDVLTETTQSEITEGGNPSSSIQEPAEKTARRRKTELSPREIDGQLRSKAGEAPTGPLADVVLSWAEDRHIRRRRDDRSYGGPDRHWAEQWARYCGERSIRSQEAIFQVLDSATAAADAREVWRFWKYLDEQVQQATERYGPAAPSAPTRNPEAMAPAPAEDSASEWAGVKRFLAGRLSPMAYANWIGPTRQIDRDGARLRVWVPDEVTREWLEQEFAALISATLPECGVTVVEYLDSGAHHQPTEEELRS